MDFADEPVAQGESPSQPVQAMLERRDAVPHLDDIVEWHARCLLHLVQEEIGQRRLGALDLRGQHRGLLVQQQSAAAPSIKTSGHEYH
jgi:hypothetical protein